VKRDDYLMIAFIVALSLIGGAAGGLLVQIVSRLTHG